MARLNLTIEYLDVHDGALSLARSIMMRDRALARDRCDTHNHFASTHDAR
jgi:hypothetical protein